MNRIFPAIKVFGRTAFSSQIMQSARLASTSSSLTSAPLYELRSYAINAKDFKAANELFAEKHPLRTKHSKLFGFWTCEIGDNITQFVHIWEYDSLSHRRKVRTAMANDEVWTSQFVAYLTPCISQWLNALMVTQTGEKLNFDFNKDPAAVYLLDEVKVDSYSQTSDVPETKPGEHLVGKFYGVLGSSNTEYRLWRYANIDDAGEASVRRANDASFEGSTRLLYPTKFSPLQ